jgi:transcription elongation factor GreA
MTLDGSPATPPDVAKRLHEFWLADEPVLYVGRSAKAVGSRLAAMYATPLGEARPHSGGHWLRTLSVLPELRIWWAETDAHEEYEDALLSEIASRNGERIPFANLMTSDGVPKVTGLLNSLRSDTAEPGSAKKTGTRRSTSPSARSKATPTARKPARPKAPAPRPAIAPTLVSQGGLAQLNAELDDLRKVQRPQIIDRVATARSHGDLKENAEYEYARKEQSFIEGRIQMLEQMINNAEVIDTAQTSDSIRVGSTVEVESEGDHFTYQIVGSTEANPSLGRLSNASPVGRALLGARVGDAVSVELPLGSVVYRVLEVR